MLKWLPIWILRIMDTATIKVAVAIIIPVDFDFLEFLLQELDISFEEFLEI
jgi:hypothetical protein